MENTPNNSNKDKTVKDSEINSTLQKRIWKENQTHC